MVFFIALTVIFALLNIANAFIYFVYHIKHFGVERDFNRKTGKTIDIQYFLPKNVTALFAEVLIMGIFGMILVSIGLNFFIALLCCVFFGVLVNFITEKSITAITDVVCDRRISDTDTYKRFENVTGNITESITADDIGAVEFKYRGKLYSYSAVSADELPIDEGTEVVIVHEEDNLCFVVPVERLYDALDGFEDEVYLP